MFSAGIYEKGSSTNKVCANYFAVVKSDCHEKDSLFDAYAMGLDQTETPFFGGIVGRRI
jgi:hypothetical protein